MFEIRWHGRGGQGVVTAAKLFALAAGAQGGYYQAFPEYGPERRGAPVQAFTRIDEKPIRTYNQVYFPDMIVVLDQKLIGRQPLADGLKSGGYFVANYHSSVEELKEAVSIKDANVIKIDASDIAHRVIGKPIPNTPMLGAAAKISGFIKMNILEKEIREFFSDKLKPEAIDANILAAREGAGIHDG